MSGLTLIDVLRQQHQCDETGEMCAVSRQAVDEAIAEIERLRAALAAAEEKVRGLSANRDDVPARVSIHGMYDCHLFHRIEAATVDGVIAAWLEHNATPNPATVGGREVSDLGPSDLCPAIVLNAKGKELRRVGRMVHASALKNGCDNTSGLSAYRAALCADPDVPRLLAAQHALPPLPSTKENDHG